MEYALKIICARRYPIETFPKDGGTKARLEYIANKAHNSTWVVSFNSPHQLETAAAIRLKLSKGFGSFAADSRPVITTDEVDQIVRSLSRNQAMEKLFDGVLGIFDRTVRVSCKYLAQSRPVQFCLC